MALAGGSRATGCKCCKVLSEDVSCWEEDWMRCLEEVSVGYLYLAQTNSYNGAHVCGYLLNL